MLLSSHTQMKHLQQEKFIKSSSSNQVVVIVFKLYALEKDQIEVDRSCSCCCSCWCSAKSTAEHTKAYGSCIRTTLLKH